MSSDAQQIPFSFAHRVAMAREDFLVAPCNAEAVSWVDRWPDWPAPALIVYGPEAAGKTHLLHVWRQRTGAQVVTRQVLETDKAPAILQNAAVLAIDDLDDIIGHRAAEEELFHLYNLLKENGGQMLLSSRVPPAQLSFAIADLKSRLLAAPAVGIGLPDDNLLTALLVKLFADRQLRVSEGVVAYIVPRVQRSFAAVQDLVGRIEHQAAAEKKPATIALVKKLLV